MANLNQVNADLDAQLDKAAAPQADVELERKSKVFLERYCYHYNMADAKKQLTEMFDHIRKNR